MPMSQLGVSVLSIENTQELISGAKVAEWKYPEVARGVDLRAPFVEWTKGVRRPVIADKSFITNPQECVVYIQADSEECRFILSQNDRLMGRPVFNMDNNKKAVSHFGDENGPEKFSGFTLHVSNEGDAFMAGDVPSSPAPEILTGVVRNELCVFGRALLRGVDIHMSRIIEQQLG